MNEKIKLCRPRKLKAFTLLEMIVVMAIIGILASIIIPSTIDQIRSSKIQTANTKAEEIFRATQNYLTDKQIKKTPVGSGGKVGITVKPDETGMTWSIITKFGDTVIDDSDETKSAFKKGMSNYLGQSQLGDMNGSAVFFICFDADTWTTDYVLYCEEDGAVASVSAIVNDLKNDGKPPYTQVYGFPSADDSGAGVTPRSQEYDTNNNGIQYVGQYPIGQ